MDVKIKIVKRGGMVCPYWNIDYLNKKRMIVNLSGGFKWRLFIPNVEFTEIPSGIEISWTIPPTHVRRDFWGSTNCRNTPNFDEQRASAVIKRDSFTLTINTQPTMQQI